VTIRVVLADDDALVRVGLRTIIDHAPDLQVVGEATDGLEVTAVVAATNPDVVLMDIRMPNRDGLAATRELLRGSGERPRVVILTTFELDEYVYEALQAGATGFLLKRAPPAELLDAIRLAANGESLIFPELTRRLLEKTVAPARGEDAALASLTGRERQVLELMAAGRSNREIAAELVIGQETVKTHVGNVLGKLQVRDRVHAVIRAYELGVVRPEG
jgi:DNA-binding NarL/FixJ family response regulator